MAKILWLDSETGGLHAGIHALLEVGMIVEIDGIVREEHLWQIKPFPDDEVDQRALEINGITEEVLAGFLDPHKAFIEMHQVFDNYIQKYDRFDKFLPAGYNVSFDLEFLEAFFKKNQYEYFFSYISHNTIDLLALVRYLVGKGLLVRQSDSFKLEAICEQFGIKAGEHSALADAKATRKLSMAIDQWMKAGFVRDLTSAITSMGFSVDEVFHQLRFPEWKEDIKKPDEVLDN